MFTTEQTWMFIVEIALMFAIILWIAKVRIPMQAVQRLAGWYLKRALRAWNRMLNRIGGRRHAE